MTPAAKRKQVEKARQLAVFRDSAGQGYTIPYNHPLVQKSIEICDLLEAMKLQGETVPYWYNQLIRSASSIAANYMEGAGRANSGYLLQFWKIARGSAYESVVWGNISQSPAIYQACKELADLIDCECIKYIDANKENDEAETE